MSQGQGGQMSAQLGRSPFQGNAVQRGLGNSMPSYGQSSSLPNNSMGYQPPPPGGMPVAPSMGLSAPPGGFQPPQGAAPAPAPSAPPPGLAELLAAFGQQRSQAPQMGLGSSSPSSSPPQPMPPPPGLQPSQPSPAPLLGYRGTRGYY